MPLPVFAVFAALLLAGTPLVLPSAPALAQSAAGSVVLANYDADDDEAYEDDDDADEAYEEDDRDESADYDDEDEADDDDGDEAAYGMPHEDRRGSDA